jgi:hypothetical protein
MGIAPWPDFMSPGAIAQPVFSLFAAALSWLPPQFVIGIVEGVAGAAVGAAVCGGWCGSLTAGV